MADKTGILMVCLGNICRSPLAEGLLRRKLNFTKFKVDSAGTSGGHKGEAPDKRSIEVARKHDIDISSQRSRKFTRKDFEDFDHIFVMDQSNYNDVTALAESEHHKNKVSKILEQAFPGENLDVPDPYYGGEQGFQNVYTMLDRATDVIAQQLESK